MAASRTFRFAEREDTALILEFIKALAEYEHMLDKVVATEALLKKLAGIAEERGCGRLEWCCLDRNKPSIDFYLSLDAEPLSDWTTCRLAGTTLNALAE